MKKTLLVLILIITGLTQLKAQDSLYIFCRDQLYQYDLSDIDSISYYNTENPPVYPALLRDPRYSLFSGALELTGYSHLLAGLKTDFREYNPLKCPWRVKIYNIKEEIPAKKIGGFTVFFESDSILNNYKECPLCPEGVRTIADLIQVAKYWYSSEYKGLYSDGSNISDFKDHRNYLNRYIAYHILTSKLKKSRLIDDFDTPNQVKKYDMDEFKAPTLENSLLRVYKSRLFPDKFFINPTSDLNDAISLTGKTLNSKNSVAHEINKPLVYSKAFYDHLSSIRLRMDASSMLPELANNDMRGNNPDAANEEGKAHRYIIPPGYCENLVFSPSTRVSYLNANGIYEDYQGDELYIEGPYDVQLKTLPIPAGTYELRLGYLPTDWRGVCQFYVDSIAVGEPVNLAYLAKDVHIGWVLPGSNPADPLGLANDSLMRKNGYMKGPDCYKCTIPLYFDVTKTARTSKYTIRRIIGTFEFKEAAPHTLRFKITESKTSDIQLMIDYLEFIPVSAIPNEGVD